MTNPVVGTTDSKKTLLGSNRDFMLPVSVLETLKRPSNHVMRKNADDNLEGLRYTVASEPSNLRPIKSWTIAIEKWECKSMAEISAYDVLFIRILNNATQNFSEYDDVIKDIFVNGNKIQPNKQNSFNAVMAAGVVINKIDAGRLPDIEKTLQIYNLA